MASSEAERIRAELFPTRSLPDCTVSEWRELELKDAERRTQLGPIRVVRDNFAGVACEWINDVAEWKRTILFLHGGGYLLGSCATHRHLASRIAIAADARVLVPEYRLAPEHPFPAAVRDAVAVYDALLERGVAPAALAVAGDSAGGGLAAALLVSIRDAGRWPMPAAAVLLSPWTDLTLSAESYRTRGELDPIDRLPLLRRMVAHYVPDGEVRAALASPLLADLRGLPPQLIQVGDHEVLLDDSVKFAEKALAAGVDVELEVWPEMWHVWQQAAPALPEANEAIARIGAFVRKRVAQRVRT